MGQTVLSLIPVLWIFETDFFVDRILKTRYNMGQTVLSFDQNLLERLKNVTQIEKNYYIKDNMG